MLAMLLSLLAVEDTLSDEALRAYAAKPWDPAEKMQTREMLGTHHAASVVAEFRCADFCPNYTIRVIHYDLMPGISCASVGGVIKTIRIPDGFGASGQSYCLPKTLDLQSGFRGD